MMIHLVLQKEEKGSSPLLALYILLKVSGFRKSWGSGLWILVLDQFRPLLPDAFITLIV